MVPPTQITSYLKVSHTSVGMALLPDPQVPMRPPLGHLYACLLLHSRAPPVCFSPELFPIMFMAKNLSHCIRNSTLRDLN